MYGHAAPGILPSCSSGSFLQLPSRHLLRLLFLLQLLLPCHSHRSRCWRAPLTTRSSPSPTGPPCHRSITVKLPRGFLLLPPLPKGFLARLHEANGGLSEGVAAKSPSEASSRRLPAFSFPTFSAPFFSSGIRPHQITSTQHYIEPKWPVIRIPHIDRAAHYARMSRYYKSSAPSKGTALKRLAR